MCSYLASFTENFKHFILYEYIHALNFWGSYALILFIYVAS